MRSALAPFFTVVMAFLIGCVTPPASPQVMTFVEKSYNSGVEISANVGSPMIIAQTGTKTQGMKWVGYDPNSPPLAIKYLDTDAVKDGWEMGVTFSNLYKRELVYSGKEGSILNVFYREYTDDTARPAFFLNLTYDLKESNLIQFQDFGIEVFSADNSRIRFRVLSEPAEFANVKATPNLK